MRQIFQKEIEEFGKFFFKNHLILETPAFHREIYEVYLSDKNRIAIGAPRSHAKSTITDLVYLAWVVANKRAKFVLLVSDTYSQAVLFLDALKAELEANEKLKAMYGDMTSKHWAEDEIVANGIMIKALGAGQKVRGLKYRESRPDLIIVDDIENDEQVMSKERREKLERWFNGALIPSMDKDGRIIVIGTVLHYDSLLYKLLKDDNYTEFYKKTYKAILSDERRETLWPEHLDYEELLKKKAEYTQKGQLYLFYQEYQNDPISGENRKFDINRIIYFDPERDLRDKRLANYITIDRAYSMAKTADYTGIIVNAVDQENYWHIIQAERFRGDEKELINYIFSLIDAHNPVKVAIEQKAFEYTLRVALEDEMRRRNKFFSVEKLKDNGANKVYRIEGLIPRFNSGTIKFRREQTDLIDELIRFPMGDYDDLADALAYQMNIAKPPSIQGITRQDYQDIQELSNLSYDEWS